MRFDPLSTERAELENFARAATERQPLAVAGGDEQHGVEVFEAILKSAKTAKTVLIKAKH
jgi:predicted dehydrogenase